MEPYLIEQKTSREIRKGGKKHQKHGEILLKAHPRRESRR